MYVKYCPRPKSDSDSESDFSTRGTRGDLPAVRQLEIKCSTWNICFAAATQKLNAPYSQVTGDVVALSTETERVAKTAIIGKSLPDTALS